MMPLPAIPTAHLHNLGPVSHGLLVALQAHACFCAVCSLLLLRICCAAGMQLQEEGHVRGSCASRSSRLG